MAFAITTRGPAVRRRNAASARSADRARRPDRCLRARRLSVHRRRNCSDRGAPCGRQADARHLPRRADDGGGARRGRRAWPVKEIGWAPLTLTPAGQNSVLAPLGASPVLHWHGDNCELPAGARGLPRRSTARCRRSRACRRSSRCSFIWRRSRRGSRAGWSATPSSSARPASIRANLRAASAHARAGDARTRQQSIGGVARHGGGGGRLNFPDIAADLRSNMPTLRGRLLPNQPLAELTWFRVGGPAQVLFMPEDEADLGLFAGQPAGGHSRHRHRSRLQSDRARRRRAGRGRQARAAASARSLIDGIDVRAGAAVPDVKVARAAQEAGIAGLVVPARHSRQHRRRAAHERRRLWPRDQGRAGRGPRCRSRRPCSCAEQRRHGLRLSALRRARRLHFHASDVSRRTRRSGGHRRGNGQDHRSRAKRRSRSKAAPAARPSKIRPGRRRGSLSTPPAAAVCASATRRFPRCTAIF